MPTKMISLCAPVACTVIRTSIQIHPTLAGSVRVAVTNRPLLSEPAANEHSITCERISLVKFPEKSFSTATPVYVNYSHPVVQKSIREALGPDCLTLAAKTHTNWCSSKVALDAPYRRFSCLRALCSPR